MDKASMNQFNAHDSESDNIKKFIEKNYATALERAFNEQKDKAYAKAKEELELELQSREEELALQQKECEELSESLAREKNALEKENQALSEVLTQFEDSILALNDAISDVQKVCEAEKLTFAATLTKEIFSLSSLPSLFEKELSALSTQSHEAAVFLELSPEDYRNPALTRYFEAQNYSIKVNNELGVGEMKLVTPTICYLLSADKKVEVLKANLQGLVDAL
ncbi:hypothetical protein GCE9029_03358 [Grimontia celer]|uniref:Chromosome partition protein Smc n=1 Tax=Grimontia celer TaxID=1796497 RepID=A0A128F788_9GAMM|nr:hypothetical protein [Grimontia celer]CZF82649.1 hypothetical protein GCE9029_03358 [Grimontia celer]